MLIAAVVRPVALERLVHRLGALEEMALVEVDDGVAKPLDESRGTHGGKRRPVLDDPALVRFHQTRCGIPCSDG